MAHINSNYLNIKESYLFSEVAKRANAYKESHPQADVIRLGIGDVTRPLCPSVIDALHAGVDDMAQSSTFKGYGPEQGYDFIKDSLKAYYAERGVDLDKDEIFISDGAKSDLGNILDIFSKDNVVLIPDPVYPVYVDTNIMDGRQVIFLSANESNGFLPLPDPSVKADLIYICSPNNPTGAVYSHADLTAWVAFARKNRSLILFDA
ncbi:MAG: aminotransferase class I/II-fold pyridoxal phosphate-dependent enzyme, partial [Clostridia bacterium]|nr:aminotransferase class I/II-fold pyridoxal phosphate-dependent enzyme [Clostridia bacterium]